MWPFKKSDYVFLIFHDGKFMRLAVEWAEGVAYAHPYLPETRCMLLPDGKVKGQSYIYGWTPATAAMSKYYGTWPPIGISAGPVAP